MKSVETDSRDALQAHGALEALLNSMTEAVVISDLDGMVIALNPAAVRLHGFLSEEEALRNLREYAGFLEVKDSQGRQLPWESWPLARAIRGEAFADQEIQVTRRDTGRRFFGSYGGTPVRDEHGNSLFAIVTIRDVTSRREVEEARTRLASIVDSSEDAIISKGLDGVVTSWNSGAERLFGWAAHEMIGKSITQTIPPDRIEEEALILERLRRGERIRHYETTRIARNGRRIEASVTIAPLHDAGGQVVGVAKILHDITDLKMAERQLRVQATALAAAANAILITNRSGVIQWVNPAFERLTGFGASEACGRTPRIVNSGRQDASFFKQMWDTILSGQVWHSELVNRRKDGQLYDEEMTITPVTGRKGITHFIAIKQDVTARKQAEQKLAEQALELQKSHTELEQRVEERTSKLREAMSELEHFSYSITHDMRAPLRAIQSFASILEEELHGCLRGEAVDYFRRIKSAAGRMDKLIQDALDYNKVVRGELPVTPIDVRKLLCEMIESYPDLQPPAAAITIDLNGISVLGNEAGLTQCFSNLLGNAVKFVAPGTLPKVRVWAEDLDGKVRIWVEDNGIGIPADGQEKIFAMFQRLHGEGQYSGTGIGLAIVRKAIERMNGRVGVKSESGKGSRFWIELARA